MALRSSGSVHFLAIVVLCACGPARCGEFPPLVPGALTTLEKNAVVIVGGEVMTDFVYRDGGGGVDKGLETRRANLRLEVEARPGIKAYFKIDLAPDERRNRRRREILEEAMLALDSLGASGIGIFAGQGAAPYGQDITLGIIQSYHHSANRVDTPEGRVHIVDTPGERFAGATGDDRRRPAAAMRPGRIDRVVMAGASFTSPDDRWKFEAAAYDPGGDPERIRPADGAGYDSDLSLAARLWWRPLERLVFEGSAVNARSDVHRPAGLPGPAAARKNAWAMSLGFDWRDGPWRVFGEFQRGWNWNHAAGQRTTIAQLGAAREFLDRWRVGATVEHMRVGGGDFAHSRDYYYKGIVNLRYTFTEGIFILVEYGHETLRRKAPGGERRNRRGDFLGIRFGFLF